MPAKTLRLSEAEWSLLREGMKWQSDPTSELDYTDEWRVLARKVAYQATFEPLHPDEPERRVKPKRGQGGEVFIPYGENGPEPMVPRVVQAQPHAVRQNDLVAALRKVAQAFPPHTETHHVLSLLARELVDPKATSGYAYGRPVTPEQFEQVKERSAPVRPMEIAWPSELDPDDRAGIAEQLEAIGHSSGLTYWLDVAQAVRSIRAPR